jgi:predicted kinase
MAAVTPGMLVAGDPDRRHCLTEPALWAPVGTVGTVVRGQPHWGSLRRIGRGDEAPGVRGGVYEHAGEMFDGPQEKTGRLVVVCGLPASGKTTLGIRLETEYGAIRFSPDEWMEAIGVDLFDERTRERIEGLQWQFALRLLELGQIVVIEWGTWGRDERDALREGARALGAAVELRFLDEPLEVLWDRVRARDMERRLGRPLTRAELHIYAAKFQRPDTLELALYDPPLV